MTDFNYFAESEQAGQQRFQRLRDRIFGPPVRLLIKCRITADMVSLTSMLMLIPAGVLLLNYDSHEYAGYASLLIWLHVFLDAFDGPVARQTGTAGPAGAFTDMCVDHSGMLVTSCLLSAAGLVDGTLAAIYVSSYTVAILFTVWLNVLGEPFRLVIRTKYILYSLVSLYGVSGRNLLDEAFIAFCAIHVFISVAGFVRVKRILRDQSAV